MQVDLAPVPLVCCGLTRARNQFSTEPHSTDDDAGRVRILCLHAFVLDRSQTNECADSVPVHLLDDVCRCRLIHVPACDLMPFKTKYERLCISSCWVEKSRSGVGARLSTQPPHEYVLYRGSPVQLNKACLKKIKIKRNDRRDRSSIRVSSASKCLALVRGSCKTNYTTVQYYRSVPLHRIPYLLYDLYCCRYQVYPCSKL